MLRAGYYWVPRWYKAPHNMAFWNKYSWPAIKATNMSAALLETLVRMIPEKVLNLPPMTELILTTNSRLPF